MRLTKAQSQFMAIGGNFPNYQRVMARYGEARGKSYKEVIAKAAQQANFRCSWNPAKGGVQRANLKDDILGNHRDPTKWKKATVSKKTGKRGKNPKGNEKRRLFFKLASKQGARKGKKKTMIKVGPSDPKKSRISQTIKGVKDNKKYLTKAAATIRNKRRMRSGAIAAGFFASAKRAGLKNKGARKVQPVKGGSASKSVYHAATDNNLKAYTVNKVAGSFNVGRKIMTNAVINTIEDMAAYAEEQFEKMALDAAQESKGGR
jgi:hypothetical protein